MNKPLFFKNKAKLILLTPVLVFLAAGGVAPVSAQPDDRIAFSITPPLIKNNVSPGQLWRSAVKVVNNDRNGITVFARAYDFRGGEETGTVRFVPEDEVSDEFSLSRWIELPPEGVKIPANESVEIPFTVRVPESAEPGGHYAAIMVGTSPPESQSAGASIKVSTMLSSLLMLTVAGEVKEKGIIREFSLGQRIYTEPNVDFSVRFENQGNVHVIPRGEIKIFDMRDKPRDSISINHTTEFNNVLPGGIRRWNFTWNGESGIMDMGRYRAELILTYGQEARETISQTRYFWIILLKPLGLVFGGLLFIILLFYLMVRRSIKKAIRETQLMSGYSQAPAPARPKGKMKPGQAVVDLKNIKRRAKR